MGVEVFRGFGVFMVFFIRGSIAEVVKEWYIVLGTVETAGGQPGIFTRRVQSFALFPASVPGGDESMTLLETLALLTLLVNVARLAFALAWTISNNKKK